MGPHIKLSFIFLSNISKKTGICRGYPVSLKIKFKLKFNNDIVFSNS